MVLRLGSTARLPPYRRRLWSRFTGPRLPRILQNPLTGENIETVAGEYAGADRVALTPRLVESTPRGILSREGSRALFTLLRKDNRFVHH